MKGTGRLQLHILGKPFAPKRYEWLGWSVINRIMVKCHFSCILKIILSDFEKWMIC